MQPIADANYTRYVTLIWKHDLRNSTWHNNAILCNVCQIIHTKVPRDYTVMGQIRLQQNDNGTKHIYRCFSTRAKHDISEYIIHFSVHRQYTRHL